MYRIYLHREERQRHTERQAECATRCVHECVCVCVCILGMDTYMHVYVCTLKFKDRSQMAGNLSQIVSLLFKYFPEQQEKL